jgi:hypothetical protein
MIIISPIESRSHRTRWLATGSAIPDWGPASFQDVSRREPSDRRCRMRVRADAGHPRSDIPFEQLAAGLLRELGCRAARLKSTIPPDPSRARGHGHADIQTA